MVRLSLIAALCAASFVLRVSAAHAVDIAPVDVKPADAKPAGPAADAGWTLNQKASYLIGIQFGERLKPFAEDLDAAKIAAAIQDALAGKEPAVPMSEGQQVMAQFQQLMQARQNEHQAADAKAGEERKGTNAKWLADNGKKAGVKTTASGLQYEVLGSGKGKQPTAKDTVKVNYRGTLIDGKEFDSSYKRGEPAEFQVGGVIKGWTEALQLMHEGDKWKLYVPSELAYGEQGPPGIGSNQVLIFEVELLSVAGAPAGAPAAP